MDDLISRQQAIDALDNLDYMPGEWSVRGLSLCKDAIKALPPEQPEVLACGEGELSAQPEPKWIPCSEREPEEYGEYRITWTTSASKKRFIGDSEYEVTDVWDADHYRFKGEWLLDDYVKNYPDVKVIAWKPLEEPYQEEGD